MKGFSAHIGYLFQELPLEHRFAAARDAGFRMVEHPSLYALPATRVRQLLSDCGLGIVQSSFPAGDIARGEKGFAALPDEIERFRASVSVSLDYAVQAGIPALHCMAGVRPPGADPERMWDIYIANMRVAAEAAAERGVLVLIEPISSGSIADYFIEDPLEAVRAITEIGASNVRLLFDVFHATMIGSDPFAFIRDHAALIYHVHIADHPGRHEPGTGIIDFDRLYTTLEEVHYDGFVGCEYSPRGGTLEGLGWMKRAGASRHA
ncbi:hydroxypyruvate isomerase family protein [Xanthobacter autotrophicus]|uniref:hydroxypyruvate isomerase family protein n=1 Tax=Xanthobacter autotrophicus TaxID=280 RepID=UPI003726E31A